MLNYFPDVIADSIRQTISSLSKNVHYRIGGKIQNTDPDYNNIFNMQKSVTDHTNSDQYGQPPIQVERENDVTNPLTPKRDCSINNPVLTADDVTDFGNVNFVADPFLFPKNGTLHMFFEVMNRDRNPNTAIGHATSTDAGRSWEYNQVVLETGNHISFPYVFEHNNTYYMLPEQDTSGDEKIELYRASEFPISWKLEQTLLAPSHTVQDAIIFQKNDRWWVLVGSGHYDTVYLYYNDSLTRGNWTPHALNPVIDGRRWGAKPSGRPLLFPDQTIIFYQDCTPEYGKQVRAFELTSLTTTEYTDKELPQSPILGPKAWPQWCSGRMHHFDPWHLGDGRWICAVDGDIGFPRGYLTGAHWSIGILTVTN